MQHSIRIAQMSDLHYSPDNLVESDRCFTAAVTQAIERGVDAAVITGDSTDHVLQAHSPAFLALAKQVVRLANHCPVLMLQGTFSHEPVGLLQMFALLGAKFPICVADRIASYGLGELGFEFVRDDAPYRLVVHALPTLNKAEVAMMASSEIGAASQLAGDLVSHVLQGWAPVNRQLRLQGVPSMVISHGTVLNCITEHGVPMAGVDHEFGVGALFAAESEAVALGHIHKHQSWENNAFDIIQRIAYAGSIGRFHHGEDGDKFWLEWSLQAGRAELKAHCTPARRTVDIVFDGAPDLDKLREADCAGAFVRLRYTVDAEFAGSVNRELMKSLLTQAGAVDVQIEGKTLVVERVRAPGISQEQDISSKLAKWAAACGNDAVLPDLHGAWQMLTNGSDVDALMTKIDKQVELSILRPKSVAPQPKAPVPQDHWAPPKTELELFAA